MFAVLLAGALLVYGAMQLPGEGGHRPLNGIALDVGPRQITSALLAALGSLAFGAVLGPEAPLLALGTAAGFAVYRGNLRSERSIITIAGAMAAIGYILGNPLVTAILVLEMLVLTGSSRGGRGAVATLLPAMIALGVGYLLQVGVGRNWDGFGEAKLAVPGLPEYPNVLPRDLVLGGLLAVVVASITTLAFRVGIAYDARARRRPLAGLVIAAAILAAAAVGIRAVTGEPIELVLFSGQAAIGDALAITSIGTLLLIALAKALAYGVSLGSGFRGGAVFPAIFLGVVLGTVVALLVDESSLPAYVAAGIAAGGAASFRLPFTSVLLAVLLCSASGLAVTSVAIVGSAVGLLVRAIIDAAIEQRAVVDVESPAAEQGE